MTVQSQIQTITAVPSKESTVSARTKNTTRSMSMTAQERAEERLATRHLRHGIGEFMMDPEYAAQVAAEAAAKAPYERLDLVDESAIKLGALVVDSNLDDQAHDDAYATVIRLERGVTTAAAAFETIAAIISPDVEETIEVEFEALVAEDDQIDEAMEAQAAEVAVEVEVETEVQANVIPIRPALRPLFNIPQMLKREADRREAVRIAQLPAPGSHRAQVLALHEEERQNFAVRFAAERVSARYAIDAGRLDQMALDLVDLDEARARRDMKIRQTHEVWRSENAHRLMAVAS